MTNLKKILDANKYGLNDWQGGDYHTPIYSVAMQLGVSGVNLSECPVVKGYRYGKAPWSGISQNYRDNCSEKGLSLACVNEEQETGSCIWFNDRQKFEYEGLLLPYKGSDGEPLILPFGFEDFD